MVTVKDFKAGTHIPHKPQYVSKPYVVLGVRGDSKDVVLAAGDLDYIKEMVSFSTYYDECIVDVRRHNLANNDNTRVAGWGISDEEEAEMFAENSPAACVAHILGFYTRKLDSDKAACSFRVTWRDIYCLGKFANCKSIGDYLRTYCHHIIKEL